MSGEITEPTFVDVLKARQTIDRYLVPTPLIAPPGLANALSCDAYLKCEHMQPVGAFKVRGGINLVANLSLEERRRGVIASSTGNHGQSIAYASRTFGVRATIVAPEGANPYKVAAMRSLGAEVILHGRDFDAARELAEQLASRNGYRYVHSANEPLLIAGVGTETLEIVEQLPDVDIIIVPIGAGSGAAGAAIVAKTVNPRIRVIGVQSEGAPAVHDSWQAKELLSTPEINTFAEGLATRVAFELPLRILNRLIDEIVLVSDDELRAAIIFLLEHAHQLAEAAGAAPVAAARKMAGVIAGKKVAMIVSGGNITIESLRGIVNGAH